MKNDLISRQAMIVTMRRHRALFCKNRIEFMALSKDEKARVDEIDNCISDLVNAPDAELEVFEFCASGENPCKEYDQEKHCCHRWTNVIRQTIEEMKAESERKWIPVTEALPEEENKSYWVCTDTKHQCECRWTNNIYGIGESNDWGWKIFDIPQYTKVIAWMPLPELWRGDEER